MMAKPKAALFVFPSAVVSLPTLAQAPVDRPGYRHPHRGWGHMIFGSLTMILLWGGFILLIILAVRWTSGGPSGGHASPAARRTPVDILQERFARGEIDKDKSEVRKRLLSD